MRQKTSKLELKVSSKIPSLMAFFKVSKVISDMFHIFASVIRPSRLPGQSNIRSISNIHKNIGKFNQIVVTD